MKETKFRAWDKENKKMYFQLNESPCFGLFEVDRAVSIEDVFFYEKQHYEVMQYTGLKDNNGREIYEGDIVKIYPNKGYSHLTMDSDLGVIEYVHSSYMIRPNSDRNPYFLIYATVEVIGNVFENFELLEESQNGTK